MKKLVVLVPLAVIGALFPALESSAAPPDGLAVPVQSAGRAAPADKAAAQEEALRADASTIARQTKRSPAKVYTDLIWQGEVEQEAQRLAEQHPDTFTGLRILSHEKRSLWVGFKGQAPEVALPADTDATVASDQPLSGAEIREATAVVERKAASSFETESSAAPDIMTGSIDVAIAKREPEPAERERGMSRLTEQTAGTKAAKAKLKVFFDPEATTKPEAASGGAKLEYTGSGSLQCTAAFAITKNGVTGMLTAQHCTSAFTHENYNGATEYGASTVASTLGSNGDLRWYNTSTNEVPQFRADYSDLRAIYSAPGYSEGAWMCHFGYGNGKSCDTVYRIGVSSGGVSNQTAMSHHYTTGGNSGGPWFYGSSGYGVHRGYTSIWFSNRAIFTPLNRVMPAFGAYILVS